jgi:hypothetical protein
VAIAKETKPFNLTEKEVKLIELCRKTAYGQLIVFLQDSEPVRTEVTKSIKL